MIFRTTYKNKDYDKAGVLLVGKKFTFLERIKLWGVGSGRLNIVETSAKLNLSQLTFSEIDYANIELRPMGIIVHYTVKLERYSWIIPYYRLAIYNAQYFSIHANGSYMRIAKNNKNYTDNKKFISRMIQIKNEYLKLEYYDY